MIKQRQPFAGWATVSAAILVAIALWASACTSDAPQADSVVVDSLVIDLRVWQDVDEPRSLWLSARVSGHPDETLDKVPLANNQLTSAYVPDSRHWFSEIDVAGEGLRVFQQQVDPDRIYVSVCVAACEPLVSTRANREEVYPFRPLGKTPVALDDGDDAAAGTRFGDLRIAIPRGNPGLLRDREHLLALRDVFDARPPVNWSVGTPTTSWEGVTLSGAPPRVTGLDLSNRNLRGEIWGYLGDLLELRELRLDGNELTGIVPTKTQLLKQLKLVRLGGNQLDGCAPPGLWSVERNDLSKTDLEECPALVQERLDIVYFVSNIGWEGSPDLDQDPVYLIVDVPCAQLSPFGQGPEVGTLCELDEPLENIFEALDCGQLRGVGICNRADPEAYIFRHWDTDLEVGRSHYTGCIYDCRGEYSPAAWAEKMAAYKWVTVAQIDEQTFTWYWVWP